MSAFKSTQPPTLGQIKITSTSRPIILGCLPEIQTDNIHPYRFLVVNASDHLDAHLRDLIKVRLRRTDVVEDLDDTLTNTHSHVLYAAARKPAFSTGGNALSKPTAFQIYNHLSEIRASCI